MVEISRPDFGLQAFGGTQGGLGEIIGSLIKGRDKALVRQETEALMTGQNAEGEKLTPLQRSKSFARLTNLGGAKNAQAVMDIISGRDKVAKDRLAEKVKVNRRNNLVLANTKSQKALKMALREQIEATEAIGGDASRAKEIMAMSDYEDQQAAITSDSSLEKAECPARYTKIRLLRITRFI